VRGVDLAYARAGEGGVPLLVVHGWPETKRIWWRNIGPLSAAGFDVIAPDLRGFGESDVSPDRIHDVPTHSRDLYALVHDALGVERVVLCGGDLGGPVIQDLALRHPDFAHRMVLFNSPLPYDAERMAGLKTRPPAEAGDYFLRQGTDADALAAELSTPDQRRRYIATFYTSRFWAHPGSFSQEEVAFMTEPFADGSKLRAGFGNYESAFSAERRSEAPMMRTNPDTEALILFGASDHVIYPDFDRMAALVFPNHVGPFRVPRDGHFLRWAAADVSNGAVRSFCRDLLSSLLQTRAWPGRRMCENDGVPEQRPLAGLRVVEIGGGVPAAFATRFLAGYGADVVRCESDDEALTPDEQAALLSGKRRIRVDDATLRRLVLAADAVVEDDAPGALAARGLAPESLRLEKPRLVVTSLTPFGQTGPHAGYAATNLVAHAAGGIHSLTGVGDRPPLQNGAQQAWKLLGLNGFGATLAALFAATLDDEPGGDWIDISAQECAAGMLELFGPRSATDSIPSPRLGNRTSAVWGLYPVRDGYGGVCALHRQVPALFALIGDPELQEPRFLDPRERMKDDAELARRVGAWLARHRKSEVVELGARHRVPLGAVWTPGELLENAALRERGFFDAVETPAGRAEVPGRPFLGLPWDGGTLSEPGADTDAVLSHWLGVTPASGSSSTEQATPSRARQTAPRPGR